MRLFGRRAKTVAPVNAKTVVDPALEARAAQVVDSVAYDASLSSGNILQMFGAGLVNLPAVGERRALAVTPFGAGVSFLARTMAGLPIAAYEKSAEGGKARNKLTDHPVAPLLTWAANHEMSARELLHAFWWDYFSGGRGVFHIDRNAMGDPVDFWPVDKGEYEVGRKDGALFYDHAPVGGKARRLAASDVVDLSYIPRGRKLAADSVVQMNQPAFQMGVAVQEYVAKFFAGGGVPMWALYQKESINADGAARAAAEYSQAVEMAQAEGRNVLVLGPGADLKQLGVDPEKAQILNVQRFVIEEMARILNMPPVFLAELSTGTFANVEQQDMHLVKHCVAHHAGMFEAEAGLKLFGREGGGRRYVEHNLSGLLRGDLQGRSKAIAQQIASGQLTPNESRERNNLPPLPGGDCLMIQGAMVSLERAVNGSAAPAGASGGGEIENEGKDNEQGD